MKKKIALTCAVTGGGDCYLKSDYVPRSPQEIADAAISAAKAGAAIAHIHVRDPKTGVFSRDVNLYEEAVRLIRESGTDIVLNMTTGMGGDWVPDDENPRKPAEGTDIDTAFGRVEHVLRCKPEICTIDCGSYNMGQDMVYIATLKILKDCASLLKDTGVTPEIEAFELGHIWQAKMLMEEGYLPANTMFMLCMGVRYGAEATTESVVAMRNHLPKGANWGAFGIGKDEFPMLAQSAVLGGNVRVGLEDNIYLSKGVLATNAQLVEKGKCIIEQLGAELMTPAEVREQFGLKKMA